MRLSFVIDHSRCIGCHACSLACKAEHDVPIGSYRTWVKYVEKGSFPHVRRFFTVLRCNHCDDAPCMTICPVTALFSRSNGIVDFDRDACIGCKACMQTCPYDALYVHPDRGTVEKCNFCAHRVENEMEPPCSTVCPTEAIVVGDIDDTASRVSRLIATKKVSVRKPEKGTRPKVFYIDGEPSALTPGVADPSGGYMWADRRGIELPDYPTLRFEPDAGLSAASPEAETAAAAGAGATTAAGSPPADWLGSGLPPAAAAQALAAAAMRGDADFYTGAWAGLSPTRAVYDVAHEEAPWGWKVSAYLWTKSVAAGAFLVAALAPWLDVSGNLATGAAPFIGLLFLALTGVLLVADLKKPARFWTILTRPNWSSWLARGAFIIAGFGALAAAWSAALLIY
jgi:Fe-S-cluster-containing dehydrogenase component